jgi:hypothetical protein
VRRAPLLLAAGALQLGTLAASRSARAEVSLSTDVNPRKVEVGDRFIVRLRATGNANDRIDNPQLKLPPGVTGSGPSVGSQSQISIVNGQMTQSVGISATWVLSASHAGTFRLGPASVQTDSGRSVDRVVIVEVVPPGSLPTPPLAGQPLDPFNVLRGLGGPGFPGFPPGFPGPDDEQEQLPQLPEEFRIERPADPIAFVRSRAVPRKVVVGEQVTLSNYAYGSRGDFALGLLTEPSRDDFLAFNLLEDGSQRTGGRFDLEGQRWIAIKVSEFALFPLKSGKLKAGVMNVGFIGRGYGNDPQGLTRTSPAVEIDVVEPPLNGRPPGYRLGDVGHYSLNAQVEPREVPAGGSISVVAKLEGTGNLPASLLTPERNGVHFLEPQVVEQVGPKRGVVQGFRTFTYVVELSQPGEQDLGELTLPYYDAKARAYGVARAALGKVTVTGVAKPAPSSAGGGATPGAHLKSLVTPPATLGERARRSASYWPSRIGYWLLLFGVPLSAALGFALSDLAKLLNKRLSERRGSLSTALDDALSQLSTAARNADAAATASAAERALFLAIEKGTTLKARSVLKSALADTLSRAEVPRDTAEQIAALLARCDELRFAGEAVELSGFASDVRAACQQVSQLKARRAQGGTP